MVVRHSDVVGVVSDEALAALACEGDAAALDHLLRRYQAWIYGVALRMLQTREDAEDAAQEILLRVATRLPEFRHASSLRTWVYRIAANCIVDRQRSRAEQAVHGFACYAAYLAAAGDADVDAEFASAQEREAMVSEARLSCTMGMLLCLTREQRLVFVLGEILGLDDASGSTAMDLAPATYRQQLHRARGQLRGFIEGRCGLVDPANACRCARKTRAFVADGIVDPQRLTFTPAHLDAVSRIAPSRADELHRLPDAFAVFRMRELRGPLDLVSGLWPLIDMRASGDAECRQGRVDDEREI
jgi:RNA polymerase sigma factor (sigma-70 family)